MLSVCVFWHWETNGRVMNTAPLPAVASQVIPEEDQIPKAGLRIITHIIEMINASTGGKVDDELRGLVLLDFMRNNTGQLDSFFRGQTRDIEVLKARKVIVKMKSIHNNLRLPSRNPSFLYNATFFALSTISFDLDLHGNP